MLIGLAGTKRSGKDTVARYLRERHGFAHESFAGPIRRFAADVLGLTADELESCKEEPVGWLDGMTPRKLMQLVGTEGGRDLIHPQLWIRSAMRRASMHTHGAGVVLSDVRFPNEAEAIRYSGGKVVRLVGRGVIGDSHVSEEPLPVRLVDFELRNDSDFGALFEQVEFLLQRLAE